MTIKLWVQVLAAAGVVASDDTILSTVDLVGGATDEDDVLDLLLSGEEFLTDLRAAARKARGGVPAAGAKLYAPIPRPPISRAGRR